MTASVRYTYSVPGDLVNAIDKNLEKRESRTEFIKTAIKNELKRRELNNI